MRVTFAIIFLVAVFSASCRSSRNTGGVTTTSFEAQSAYQQVNYADPSTWLLGYISPGMFSSPPHSDWFVRGKDEYQAEDAVLDQLRKSIGDDLSILIVLGTWCPDSRREVPRFMKIVEETGFPVERIVFIGVDNTKLAPVGGYDTLNIERVPTFIFLRNKVEAGRIIETPVTSLEQDMQSILTRNEN